MKKLLAYLLVHRSPRKDRDLSALDKRQTPTGSASFNDSFYFCGRGADGTSAVFRLGFRPGRNTELWCDLVLPGLGRLRAPVTTAPDSGNLSGAGLRFTCTEPGRTWTVAWSGPMRAGSRDAHVDLSLEFLSDAPIVDFGAHGDTWSLAGYLAGEKWSRAWFAKLRDLSQVHYEQAGTLTGTVTVDGVTRHVSLAAIRDHSFGSRDWRAMRRHAWLMALMEDGTRLNVSLVSYDFLPFMHSGYRERGGVIEPVTRASRFEALPAGNPKGMSFTCPVRIGASDTVTLECRVDDVLDYSMDGVYGFFEGLAAFTLGTVKGVGICELGFAHDDPSAAHPPR